MESKLEGPAVTVVQKTAKPAGAMYLRAPLSDYWDSGFDSDEPSLIQPSLSASDESSDEDFLDNMRKEKKDQEAEGADNKGGRDALDILIHWRQNGPNREPSISEPSTDDRSSPPLFEVELTASDEDDDASVLELVIPMQSRYQRVPTSSPKKSKAKKPTLFSSLFCCIRK